MLPSKPPIAIVNRRTALGILSISLFALSAIMRSDDQLWDAPESLLRAAEEELEQSHIQAAETYLNALINSNSDRYSSNPAFLTRLFRALAIVYRDSNKIDSAIGSYDQLDMIARETKNQKLVNEATIGKIMVLTNNDRTILADHLLRRRDAELRATTPLPDHAEYFFWKARVMEDLGDIAPARDLVTRKVLPLSLEYEDTPLQIARYALASRLALLGEPVDWKRAESDLQKGRDILRHDTPRLRRGQLIQGVALFELRTGDLDSAERHADMAEEIFKTDGIVSHQLRRLRERLAKL